VHFADFWRSQHSVDVIHDLTGKPGALVQLGVLVVARVVVAGCVEENLYAHHEGGELYFLGWDGHDRWVGRIVWRGLKLCGSWCWDFESTDGGKYDEMNAEHGFMVL
jgi:hypothetical protein